MLHIIVNMYFWVTSLQLSPSSWWVGRWEQNYTNNNNNNIIIIIILNVVIASNNEDNGNTFINRNNNDYDTNRK